MADEQLELEVSAEEKRTKVYRHPDCDMIRLLIRNGKTAEWIAGWLAVRYPVEDEMGVPVEGAERNKRWQLAPTTIRLYRQRFMPECAPGLDIIDPELEAALGPRLPAASEMGAQFELQILETVIQANMGSLARAIKSDTEMEMVQGVTLEASKVLTDALKARVEIAQSLGVRGYPRIAEKTEQKVTQSVTSTNTNKNLNIDMIGGVKEGNGFAPREPTKIRVLQELMDKTPDEVSAILRATEETVDAEVVEDDGLPGS